MTFLILLFFLLFPHPVFATSNIQITDYSVKAPEWIQITNSSSELTDVSGWYFKDASGNNKILDGCISPNSTKVYEYSGFLNDTGESLSLYDKTNSLIQDLGVINITQKDKPSSSSTCVIPTNTPTPTTVPTSTPTPTNTPTPDPAVTNPSNGINLTEFMPYSDPEWLEIYNANDYPVKLVSWKVEDLDGNVKNIDSLSIPAKGYAIFEPKSLIFDNNSNEKIIFRNQDNKIINEFSYNKGQLTLDRSWSLINGNWCQSSITKGYGNVTSCYTTPTNTPTPSATPTPDPNTDTSKYTSAATESAIIEPTHESSFLTPTATVPTSTATSGLILGGDTTNTTKKRNYLPLILIIGGGILLISPTIITKIKSKK